MDNKKKYYIATEGENLEMRRKRGAISMAWSFFRINPRKSPVFVYKRVRQGVKCVYAIVLERASGEILIWKRKKGRIVKQGSRKAGCAESKKEG